jgi:CheY-like chemotaxis protein
LNRMPSSHVLAIHPDQLILFVVNDILEEAGYRVSLLSHYDHHLDEIKSLAPDIIILDYQWSGDDNKWSLLQLLRLDPLTASIPIVLCTGAIREADGLRDHFDTIRVKVVPKPYLAASLLSAISAISIGATAKSDDWAASTGS